MTGTDGPPTPIVLAITELDVGGAEQALVALATRLDPARWRVRVVCLGPEAALSRVLREREIETVCLDVNRRRPIDAVGRLATALRESRPAIVQSFLFHANVACRLAARRAGRPIVVGGVRVAEREKGWHLLLERLTEPMTAGVVCVSAGVARHLRRRIGWPARKIVVIPNGIDAARFEAVAPTPRSEIGVDDGAPLALFVGRIARQKGVDVLIEAARIVARSRPDWRLALVGEGPSRAEIEGPTRDDPLLAGRIRWLGFRDDVPALLRAADLFVLPSRWEGMPNAVLEAMAAGTPVVATRVEGTEELIADGRTGRLVPPGDPGALADAILGALSDRAGAARWAEAARAVVLRDHGIDAVVARYEALWRRLLAGGPFADSPEGSRASEAE